MIALTQHDSGWSWSLIDRYGDPVASGTAGSDTEALQEAWSFQDSETGEDAAHA